MCGLNRWTQGLVRPLDDRKRRFSGRLASHTSRYEFARRRDERSGRAACARQRAGGERAEGIRCLRRAASTSGSGISSAARLSASRSCMARSRRTRRRPLTWATACAVPALLEAPTREEIDERRDAGAAHAHFWDWNSGASFFARATTVIKEQAGRLRARNRVGRGRGGPGPDR